LEKFTCAQKLILRRKLGLNFPTGSKRCIVSLIKLLEMLKHKEIANIRQMLYFPKKKKLTKLKQINFSGGHGGACL
jgi:hypothetical protein